MTPLNRHDDAILSAMSFTIIDDVETDNFGKRNYQPFMKGLEPISDSGFPSSVHSDTTRHYGPESHLEEGRDRVREFPSSNETDITTAATSIHRIANPLHITEAKYTCATETYGCTEVRVGKSDYIPRWCRGSVLSYLVDAKSFPTPAEAMQVKAAMQEAISMWKGIAVSFEEVDCYESATFVITYHPRGCRTAYARAFFPDELPGELLVYNLALSNGTYLANILAHEIGHIFGLRHEFADEDKQERKLRCVLFGKNNSRSVMNYYKDLGQLQVSEQDLKELEAFYAYGGEKYKGLPIHDYDPVLRKRIVREKTHSSHAMRKSGRRFSYRALLGKVDSFFSETLHAVK